MTDKLVPDWLGTSSVKDVPSSGDATSSQVVKGDDTRLSDARTPTSHAASHATGGADPITPASIGASVGARRYYGYGSVIAPLGNPSTWANCGTAQAIFGGGFLVPAPLTISAVHYSLHTPGDAGTKMRAAIYDGAANSMPGTLLWQSADQPATAGGVSNRTSITVSPSVTVSGVCWVFLGFWGWTSTRPSPNKVTANGPDVLRQSWDSWGVAHEARLPQFSSTFSGVFGPGAPTISQSMTAALLPWVGLTIA